MCGSPGAGKSTTISQLNSGKVGARVVNTDKLIEYFSSQGIAGDVDKAKLLTKEQLTLYLNSMLPLFIDSTSTNPNALIRRRGLIESIGYDTGLIIVNTSLETVLQRIKQRNRQVPEDVIRKKHKEAQDLSSFYKSKFDFYVEINNDDGEITDELMADAFKKTTEFFTSPLDSPIGQKTIFTMKEKGYKYLSDGVFDMGYLKNLVSVWYRK